MAVLVSLSLLTSCSNLFGGSKKFKVHVANGIGIIADTPVVLDAKGSGDDNSQRCYYGNFITCNIDTDYEFPGVAKGSLLIWATTANEKIYYLTSSELTGKKDVEITNVNGGYNIYRYGKKCKSAVDSDEPILVETGVAESLTKEEAAALGFVFD